MLNVLALDTSKSGTGWAHGRPFDVPVSGTVSFSRAGKSIGYAMCRMGDFLSEKITECKPDLVAFESPLTAGKGNAPTRRLLICLAGEVERYCDPNKIRCVEAEVSTIRKHFCGHGRAKKPQVMSRCDELGWAYVDDNAADALALWDYAIFQAHPTLGAELTMRRMADRRAA